VSDKTLAGEARIECRQTGVEANWLCVCDVSPQTDGTQCVPPQHVAQSRASPEDLSRFSHLVYARTHARTHAHTHTKQLATVQVFAGLTVSGYVSAFTYTDNTKADAAGLRYPRPY